MYSTFSVHKIDIDVDKSPIFLMGDLFYLCDLSPAVQVVPESF